MQDDNLSEFKADKENVVENKELNIYEALVPVVILMGLLAYNIFFTDGSGLVWNLYQSTYSIDGRWRCYDWWFYEQSSVL